LTHIFDFVKEISNYQPKRINRADKSQDIGITVK